MRSFEQRSLNTRAVVGVEGALYALSFDGEEEEGSGVVLPLVEILSSTIFGLNRTMPVMQKA